MKKLILPILIILLLPLIYQSTPTEILKLKIFDSFIQTPNESGNFVILNITEEDVESEGGYPLPRKRLAEIQLEMLGKGGVTISILSITSKVKSNITGLLGADSNTLTVVAS